MHLCEIGVLQSQGASECASSIFIVPKKDGRVHWVSDLRELNKVVRRRQYPLPIIQDILKRCPGYQFFTMFGYINNIILLNLMISQKICILLLHPLESLNTIGFPWDSNVLLIMPKR